MTIKIEDFALGNQQPKNQNEKPNLNQLSTLSEEELQGVVGGLIEHATLGGSMNVEKLVVEKFDLLV